MYLLEGNIGVGKSTFLTKFAQHCPDITVVQEPLDSWDKHLSGQSLLERFYTNPHRWAYTIETMTMMARIRDHMREQEHPNPLRVMERSIYSGHYCFGINSKLNGFLSDLEWSIYSQWIDHSFNKKCLPPKGFIYLRTSPEVCFERIGKRGRESEKGISFEYVKQIHDQHEKFLINKEGLTSSLKKVPVLVLDCTQDFANDDEIFAEHLEQLRKFFAPSRQAIARQQSL
ncbi:MAG: deoxynucleoside kinase [Neisseriaceae bacterium]|nr:deoxynucleoside kinase [Neisseriaceae bacterium]